VGSEPADGLIYKLFCEWFEDVDLPDNNGTWNKMVCPFHNESRPSATISYEYDAFRCHACGVAGDALKLIQDREGCGFQDSKRYAEGILGKSYTRVPHKPGKKSGGPRVFGKSRPNPPRKGKGTFSFPDWIR
jgi:hypothetical protein